LEFFVIFRETLDHLMLGIHITVVRSTNPMALFFCWELSQQMFLGFEVREKKCSGAYLAQLESTVQDVRQALPFVVLPSSEFGMRPAACSVRQRLNCVLSLLCFD
jgi:hypothetical protein